VTVIPVKPLGRKAYLSIPHLPGSRRGPGDHGVNPGQGRICLEKPRAGERIIALEKLDGSCVAVARIEDALVPLIRAGWPAETSPHEMHRLFAAWVWEHQAAFLTVLRNGEWVAGEWLALAHGTRYELRDRPPFVAFDLMREGERAPFDELRLRVEGVLALPHVLHDGKTGFSIASAMAALGARGHYDAADPVEGAVWRVEVGQKVHFLAKYVRPDKVDGALLPEISGQAAIWNWHPAYPVWWQ
jgi:hypothetical protein